MLAHCRTSSRIYGPGWSGAADGQGQVIDRMADQPQRVITRWGFAASPERGRDLKAMNAVKLTTEGVLVPTRYGMDLMPAWNEVSSIIDFVRIFPRIGGEAFERSYVRGYGEGAEVADGANYHESDMAFGLRQHQQEQNHGVHRRGRGRPETVGHRL